MSTEIRLLPREHRFGFCLWPGFRFPKLGPSVGLFSVFLIKELCADYELTIGGRKYFAGLVSLPRLELAVRRFWSPALPLEKRAP